MRKLGILISILTLCVQVFGQREPITSQYILHPALVNPAAIGLKQGTSGALLFQSQWTGYQDAPRTLIANYNTPLKAKNSYAGGMLISDQVGIHSRIKLSGIYSQRFDLTKSSYFAFGVAPAIDFIQSDYSKAKTDYENDPLFSTSSQSLLSFNSGAGIHYYNNKFWAGFSIPEFIYNKPSVGDGGALTINLKDWNYQLSAGWKTDVGKFFTLKPSVMARYSVNAPLQTDFNALIEYREKIGFGVSYRTMNSLNILANYQITNDFTLGYAFNTQLGSQIAQHNSGTHEIALIYGSSTGRKQSVNLHKKIKDYRKKKMKEVEKKMKEAEKKKKKEAKKKKKEKPEDKEEEKLDQPYS